MVEAKFKRRYRPTASVDVSEEPDVEWAYKIRVNSVDPD